jgi:hypothetical protein
MILLCPKMGDVTHALSESCVVFPAAFEKSRLNIDKKGTPSALGKYLGHIK